MKGPETPDDPHALVLAHVPTASGRPIREQHRLGRMQPMQTSYEILERNVYDPPG